MSPHARANDGGPTIADMRQTRLPAKGRFSRNSCVEALHYIVGGQWTVVTLIGSHLVTRDAIWTILFLLYAEGTGASARLYDNTLGWLSTF